MGILSPLKATACTVAKPYLRTIKQLFPLDLILWILALTSTYLSLRSAPRTLIYVQTLSEMKIDFKKG